MSSKRWMALINRLIWRVFWILLFLFGTYGGLARSCDSINKTMKPNLIPAFSTCPLLPNMHIFTPWSCSELVFPYTKGVYFNGYPIKIMVKALYRFPFIFLQRVRFIAGIFVVIEILNNSFLLHINVCKIQ